MENLKLNEIIKEMYDACNLHISQVNMRLEREFFSSPDNKMPIQIKRILGGVSYEDSFTNFKCVVKTADEESLNNIFQILNDVFLFSVGCDMMFKFKLDADMYTSVFLDDLIYPLYENHIKSKYNDVSVMREHPNYDANMESLNDILRTFSDIQSLLYLLYCHDFQFLNGWESVLSNPDNSSAVIEILKNSKMTIGDFLKALVDYKCAIMKDIFSSVENPRLKRIYLKKVEELKEEKRSQVDGFPNSNLPITYFLDHTIMDFISSQFNNSSDEDDTGKKPGHQIILK